jgi:hypothetical protein
MPLGIRAVIDPHNGAVAEGHAAASSNSCELMCDGGAGLRVSYETDGLVSRY